MDALFTDNFTEKWLQDLSDAQLGALTLALPLEHRRRALACGDEDAIVEKGFAEGFVSKTLLPVAPFVEGAFIVCAGSKINISKSSHRCRFVSVNDGWVWQSSLAVRDEMRPVVSTNGGTLSVTLLPVIEGLELDVVTSKARNGVHERQRVDVWKVIGGEVFLIGTKYSSAQTHR